MSTVECNPNTQPRDPNRFPFTDALIKALPPSPEGKRKEYHDAKTPYLILRVTDRGIKTFAVYRKFRDKAVRVTIGHYPEISIEEARAQAHEINSKIARGIDPRIKVANSDNTIIFADLFKTYIEDYAKHHCKTWSWMQAYFRRYMTNIASKPTHMIGAKDLQELHTAIAQKHGKTTANRTIEIIRAVFNRAIKWDLCSSNPASKVTLFRLKSRARFLESHEFPDFLDALEECSSSTIRDLLRILLYTPARSSNVMKMRWEHINFERETWYIPETKNGEPQTIPLVDEAMEILTRRFESKTNEWVFPGHSANGHITRPHRTWKRILDKAGIKDMRIHDLRRTHGSWQAATGASLLVIGKTLNHKDSRATSVYAQLNLDPVRQAMSTAVKSMLAAGARNRTEAKPKQRLSIEQAKASLSEIPGNPSDH